MSWRRRPRSLPSSLATRSTWKCPHWPPCAAARRAYLRLDTPRHQNLAHARSQPAIGLAAARTVGWPPHVPRAGLALRSLGLLTLSRLSSQDRSVRLDCHARAPLRFDVPGSSPRRYWPQSNCSRQLDNRAPGLVHQLDRWSACRWRSAPASAQTAPGAVRSAAATALAIIGLDYGQSRFPCAFLVVRLHLAVLLSRVSWLANPILSDSPGKPPPSTFN